VELDHQTDPGPHGRAHGPDALERRLALLGVRSFQAVPNGSNLEGAVAAGDGGPGALGILLGGAGPPYQPLA